MDNRLHTRWFPRTTAIALFIISLFSSGCGTVAIDVLGISTCDIFNCDSVFFRYAASAEEHNEDDEGGEVVEGVEEHSEGGE